MGQEQRAKVRRSVRQGARLAALDGVALGTCVMVDVSAGGARLLLQTSDPLPSQFLLLLSRNGNLRRLCTVAWQTGAKAGVEFVPG
jgi:hypothetical protein